MVAGTTATRTARKPKPAYRPRITFLSAHEYLVPSDRFAGQIIYKVTVMPSGRAQCECRSSDFGKPCKHIRLVLAAHAYRQSPSHLQSAAALPEKESGLGVRVASSGLGYEIYELRTGALICTVDDPATAGLPTPPRAPTFIPAPTAFAELFAA